ncbi:transmembrane 4 L6 family member 5 isoform X2 [Caretta caretta]|uniref:transmembrane 4 L6 family member 5 isoform X2 n=1 Tax=Caretta caretta TaxID=8467 RepID=UPI0020953E3B|nr:transmembrane 4 L6 family member 5-like isoform X2 [Caretta caretta]
MCTGKCSRVVGLGLLPLALTCIVCNLLLCFPDWDTQYVHEGGKLLTPAVLYLGGLVGGGIMILIPAIHIQATGRQGCCGNRCGMFLSILFALVGLAGSVYAVSVSALGLVYGPLCQVLESNGSLGKWEQPFTQDELSEQSYLFNTSTWDTCAKPPGVVRFNVILFALVLAASLLELLLCGVQVLNGLFGCLCGTCSKKRAEHTQS